jgi:hypothetical protein
MAVGKSICVTSLTGVAATMIPQIRKPATTFHSALHLQVNSNEHKHLKPDSLIKFRDFIETNTIVLFIVDEIGMGSPRTIKILDMRLKELMGNDLLFGGVSVLLAGDLHQLRAVRQVQIYDAAFNLDKCDDHDREGFFLFTKFRLHRFNQQMRCEDEYHASFSENLRNGITTGLKEYVKEHILSESNTEDFGPPTVIVSPGNAERIFMELKLLHNWSKKFSPFNKVISWSMQGRVGHNSENLRTAISQAMHVGNITYLMNIRTLHHFLP